MDHSVLSHCFPSFYFVLCVLNLARFGEYKCVCHPGYHGNYCQFGPDCSPEKHITPCQNHGVCRQFGNEVLCKCQSSFRGARCEAKISNSTTKDMRNFIVEVSVPRVTSRNPRRPRLEVPTSLKQSLFGKAANFQIRETNYSDSILTMKLSSSAELHDSIYDFISDAVKEGFLGNLSLSSNLFSFRSYPQLSIINVSQRNDRNETEEYLHVACRLRGPPTTHVTWYINNYSLNVHKATRLRKTSVLQFWEKDKNSEDLINHLVISEPLEEDEGLITCLARDDSISDTRSINVVVGKQRPTIFVKPAIVFAKPGQKVVFECHTDTHLAVTGFVWSKGHSRSSSRPLNDRDPEAVNTCRGKSQLVITEPQDVLYTCHVLLNESAAAREARVILLSPKYLNCSSEFRDQVFWKTTLVEHEDVQPCPSSPVFGAVVTRRCVRTAVNSVRWKAPDWSQCTSQSEHDLMLQIRHLLIGFDLNTPVSQLLCALHTLVKSEPTTSPMRSALIVRAAKSLLHILHYLTMIKSDTVSEVEVQCLQIAETLLRIGHRTLHLKTKVKLLVALKSLIVDRSSLIDRYEEKRSVLVHRKTESYFGNQIIVHLPAKNKSAASLLLGEAEFWHHYNHTHSQFSFVLLATSGEGHQLTEKLPIFELCSLQQRTFSLWSDIKLVDVHKLDSNIGPSPCSVSFKLSFLTNHRLTASQLQLISCVQLFSAGQWKLEACPVEILSESRVQCVCALPGVYALALQKELQKKKDADILSSKHLNLVIICCSIPLMSHFYNLAIVLVHIRTRGSPELFLALQTVVMQLFLSLLALICVGDWLKQQLYPVSNSFFFWLISVSICSQLACKISVLHQSLQRGSSHAGRLHSTHLIHAIELDQRQRGIVLFLSHGVPLFTTCSVISAQHTLGWHRLTSFFVTPGTCFFYGSLLLVSALFICDTLLLFYVRAHLAHVFSITAGKVWLRHRQQVVNASFLLNVSVIFCAFFLAMIAESPSILAYTAFTLSSYLTGICSWYLCKVIVRKHCCSCICVPSPWKRSRVAS